jgi:hypothetical protein
MSEQVQDKLRYTVDYFKVYAALINAAEHRGLVTYQEIAEIMGLPSKGAYMGAAVGRMIGVISEDEVRHGRPMLSALAVGVDRNPGKAFFTWARELGKLHSDDPEEEERFWEEEKQALYQVWRKKFK